MMLHIMVILSMVTSLQAFAAKPIPSEVLQYDAKLKAYRAGKTSLPELYGFAQKVSEVLKGVLEDLTEEDFSLTEQKMEGFSINRDEVIFAEPLPGFFENLAMTKGTKSDKDFFSIWKKTKPDGVRWAFFEPQTDVTGCNHFNGTITDLYKSWKKYSKNYGTDYREIVDKIISGLEKNLLEEDCICDSKEAALKETANFINADLSESVKTKAKKRLADLKSNTGVKFNCVATM